MGPEGAANIIFRNEIKSSENPEETRKKLIEEYRQKFANPYVAAAYGYIDAVIEPSETRNFLVHSLALAPVGMRGGNPDQQKAAQAEKVAVLAEVRAEPQAATEAKPASKRAIPPPRPAVAHTRIIDQPVRSGQRIYANGGDLIVMAQVSPGAE